MEEINKHISLEAYSKPDIVIRINLEYKKLEKIINIREQTFFVPERNLWLPNVE